MSSGRNSSLRNLPSKMMMMSNGLDSLTHRDLADTTFLKQFLLLDKSVRKLNQADTLDAFFT